MSEHTHCFCQVVNVPHGIGSGTGMPHKKCCMCGQQVLIQGMHL